MEGVQKKKKKKKKKKNLCIDHYVLRKNFE